MWFKKNVFWFKDLGSVLYEFCITYNFNLWMVIIDCFIIKIIFINDRFLFMGILNVGLT